MAKHYFQDIVPQEEEPGPGLPSERGIRNIAVQRQARSRPPSPETLDRRGHAALPARRWLWIAAGLAVLVLALFLVLFVFRRTAVTVVPQTHTVVFDPSTQFIAYPAEGAATGTLSYTVSSADIEDSEVVQASGTEHVETKASGAIVVVNDYSASRVNLVKNTRFETPSGLVFRAPAAIVIPGKKGSSPGKVEVTVAADQIGEQYNIGPVSRFTLPGLRSTPAMYSGVYAYSTASTTGGFSGEQPKVAPAALSSAIADIRARLAKKAQDLTDAMNTASTTVFSSLAKVSYRDMPNTSEGSGVRVPESAHVEVPVFPSELFAQTVAQTVSADAQGSLLHLVGGQGFGARLVSTAPLSLGVDTLAFSLQGQALLVWNVDTAGLARALSGRGQDAFQAIVSNFPGIQEAHARIEPFWEHAFPSNPSNIQVMVQAPAAQ